jgi:arginine decarboxylase
LNDHTYIEHMRQQFGVPADGRLNGFISRRDGQLFLDDRINLNELIQQYGAPLEVAYLPLITRQIDAMHAKVAYARQATHYTGEFFFAYATKANFAEEVVRTALQSGAHYETSASADIIIAHQLWRQGILANDRYMFCNGSKDIVYRDAMIALRDAGYERIVPIVDDLAELDYLIHNCTQPLLLGVRARFDIGDVDADHPGGERFGLTPHEIQRAVTMLQGTPHRLVLYHAMVGSQMEDAVLWQIRLGASVEAYAALAAQVPDLTFFNFGGGMPTDAYAIDFTFDYQGFLQGVMKSMQQACAHAGVAVPHLVGEFGRYTVASHSVYLMEVGAVKAGRGGAPDWYLLNGSLMVSLPDTLIVEGQQFIVLPLDNWHLPVRPVRLAGRYTCDTDDYYPRSGQAPLLLPANGEQSVLAFFGIGAYQQMIAGRGGAHHCLTPEMRRIIIEYDDDALVLRETPAQDLNDIMVTLGYHRDTIELRRPAPSDVAERSQRVIRMPARRTVRPLRRMPR